MRNKQDEHGTLRSYKRWQEIRKARANNPLHIAAKIIREEAVKISDLHGMSIEQAEQDIRSVINDIPEMVIDEDIVIGETGKFKLLSWSLTEHPLPGCEITTVIKENQ